MGSKSTDTALPAPESSFKGSRKVPIARGDLEAEGIFSQRRPLAGATFLGSDWISPLRAQDRQKDTKALLCHCVATVGRKTSSAHPGMS